MLQKDISIINPNNLHKLVKELFNHLHIVYWENYRQEETWAKPADDR